MDSLFSFFLNNMSQPALVLVGVYFMLSGLREAVTRLSDRLDRLEEDQHVSKVEGHRVFALRDDLNNVAEMVRDHESRISRVEGRL